MLKEDDVPGETQMEGVEHLGQYVYEMTNSKVQQLRAERGLPEAELAIPKTGDAEEVEVEEVEMAEGFETEEAEEARENVS